MKHPNLVREHFTLTGKPKKTFVTKGEAEVQAHKLNQRAYKCALCEFWT